MGLFDRLFKKKSIDNQPSQDAAEIQEVLDMVRLMVQEINDAADPDSFLYLFQSLIHALTSLCKYEGKYPFKNSTPTDEIQYLTTNYVNFTYGLIERISSLPDESETFQYLHRLLDLDFPEPTKQKARDALWNMKSGKAKRDAAAFCFTMKRPHFFSDEENKYFDNMIEEAFVLGTDYLSSGDNSNCCAGCAMYRNRIYSISGKDPRLPRIPEYTCNCCGLSFRAFLREPTPEEINQSNRPFIDDRTEEEKKGYQYILDYRWYKKFLEKEKQLYNALVGVLPNDAPKSFSAFRRMKNANTKNFQELAQKASQNGLNISITKGERIALERYQAYCQEHGYKL